MQKLHTQGPLVFPPFHILVSGHINEQVWDAVTDCHVVVARGNDWLQ